MHSHPLPLADNGLVRTRSCVSCHGLRDPCQRMGDEEGTRQAPLHGNVIIVKREWLASDKVGRTLALRA